MRKTMRRGVVAMMVSTATLVLSACGGSSGGTEPAGQDSPTPVTSKSDKPSGPPLAGVQPCETVTADQASKLGLTSPGKVSEFDDSTCKWGLGEHYFYVSTYTDKALSELNFSGDKKTPKTFRGHKALRVIPGKGRCALAFAATNSTSVVVRATADVSAPPGKACEIVKKAAPMVESTIFDS